MKRVLALAVALMLTVIGCDGGDGGDGDGGDGGTTTTEAAAASETVEIADLRRCLRNRFEQPPRIADRG